MREIDMENLGLTEAFIAESLAWPDWYVGRVLSQYKGLYKVGTSNGELQGEISGKFRFEVARLSDYPAVGDFVMMDRRDDREGNAIIHRVLTRKSAFIRKAAGTSGDKQVVAANIDTVFICMSLNRDYNLRRVERYLGIAWESGALPVVVLTKADLCEDIPEKFRELETAAPGAEVLVTSSVVPQGREALAKYLGRGETVAFIGSSGVGKSTLINRLLGRELIETKAIRGDDRGRHTTTRRELFVLPEGGVVIDTPGMRELGIESADFKKTFVDIDDLAEQCRFRDCTHTKEPGCAVQRAVREGILSENRLANYLKMKKEAGYEGLNSRQIEARKIDAMFAEVGGVKNARRLAKSRKKRREW